MLRPNSANILPQSPLSSPLPPAPLCSVAVAPMMRRWIAAAWRRGAPSAWQRTRALSYGRVVHAAARDGELRVFVVAGEVSGDSLASRLMASLRVLSPVPVRFAGVGGCVLASPPPYFRFSTSSCLVLWRWRHIRAYSNTLEPPVFVATFAWGLICRINARGAMRPYELSGFISICYTILGAF
jgi:hypothetical protein